MTIKPLELNENDRAALDKIIKKSADWRERNKAEIITLLTEPPLKTMVLPKSAKGHC